MRRMIRSTHSLTLAAVLLLGTACAEGNQQGNEALTQGLFGGALLGAGLGAAFGGKRGAAIGAGLGAALGTGIGYAIDQRKRQYASQEDFYNAQIGQTAQLNQEMDARNGALQQSVAEDRRQVERLVAAHNAGSADRTQLANQRAELDRRRQENAALLASLNKELEVQQGVLAEMKQAQPTSQHTTALETQVASLRGEVSELKSMVDDLGTQSATLGQYL